MKSSLPMTYARMCCATGGIRTKIIIPTRSEVRKFLIAGHPEDQIFLDQLYMLSQKYIPRSETIEKQVLLGILLTGDNAKQRLFLTKEFHDERFKIPDHSVWASVLYTKIFKDHRYHSFPQFKELQSRFFTQFPILKSPHLPTPCYRKDFWWEGQHFEVGEVLNSEDYGYIYKGTFQRKFTFYVPEAYLHTTQPSLKSKESFKKGEFVCLPGHYGELYRYALKTDTNQVLAEIETLDKYSQPIPSACLVKPPKGGKWEQSVAEVHSSGLQLFQSVQLQDKKNVIVSALLKNGSVVGFDGFVHTKITNYTITTRNRFEIGDEVTCPYIAAFSFGNVIHKRFFEKGKHVFWEYAILINERKRQGVFYYPEAILTLLKPPAPESPPRPSTIKADPIKISVPAIVRSNVYSDVLQTRLKYAVGSTLLILLYALI